MTVSQVTVCIPVLNEEANIQRCLDSLTGFPHIVLVDSGSTDRTVAIGERKGARILSFAWDGQFPKKRNWALRNHRFETDWILFLDADEQVTPAFRQELQRVLADTPHNGFWLSYTNFFMGKPLRHGVPQRKLALFRIGSGEYEYIKENRWSHFDMEIHEHPQIIGSVGQIESRLIHHDYKSLRHYVARHNEYSSWEAHRTRAIINDRDKWSALTGRQRLKYRMLGKPGVPLAYFLYAYVLRAGFLDGRAGFHHALQKAQYFYLIGQKLREPPQIPGDQRNSTEQ